MLLLPAALWYHYLVVLLPLAILAWPRATRGARVGMVIAGLCVSGGVAWLPMATVGWVTMALVIVGVLSARPRPVAVGQPAPA
jgi:hypothetical protein